MNKLIATSLLAAGLLLLDAPEAAAHPEVRDRYVSPAHYRADNRRAHPMPRWLKRHKAFRHWYSHTRLKHNRRLGWHQLFDIYRWERFSAQRYRGDRRYWDQRRYRGVPDIDRFPARRHRH